MIRGSLCCAILLALASPAVAQGIDGRLAGAWATSQAECKKLFARAGGGFAFKRPVDQFAQAALITPGAVVTPNQTCRVNKTSQNKGVTTLDFECKDTISYTSQSVEIEVKSGSEMIYRPNGDKTLDTTLVRCQ